MTLDRCFWCGQRNRQASDWEQENYAKGWQRLCRRCATVRLNNPWNALLSMRKVEVPGAPGGGTVAP
jgi:hypothetical protein